MRACTVSPGRPDTAGVEQIKEPGPDAGEVLVEGLLTGVCGTDVEIVTTQYGWPPPGHERIVLFHESLGRVLEAPDGSGLVPGDLVSGIVRRPDPVPCPPCSRDDWDFCRNGRYTERGIKEIDGFGAERWRSPAKYVVKVDAALGDLGVLTEPASVVAKAWDYTLRLGRRTEWEPSTALVTGAGPIGLLAAMIAVQKGYDTHVVDLVADGLKPDLVRQLGATYHRGLPEPGELMPDAVIECTGVGPLVFELADRMAPDGVMCLTGIAAGGTAKPLDASAVNKDLVLSNGIVFGSVNAGKQHYEQAAAYLAAADPGWLAQLVTRRVPMAEWPSALERSPDDVKVVVDLQA
jgi:threonine dehydrogenase-like Zn-dependent dehydrogenase